VTSGSRQSELDVWRKERLQAGFHVGFACILMLLTMGRATIVLVVTLLACYAVWASRSEWPPPENIISAYVIAVVVQCAHLLEEYRAGFYRVFPPIFGGNPWSARQFPTFNVVWLIVFLIAGFGLVRRRPGAYLIALFLAIGGGIGNGLGHIALSVREGGYFPGAYTGVLALLAGSALAYRLMRQPAPIIS
jgi:hypothetical protein